jgi:hypothetical protein
MEGAAPDKVWIKGKGGLDFVIAYKPEQWGFASYLPSQFALFCHGCLSTFGSITQFAHYHHSCLCRYRPSYEPTVDKPRLALEGDLHTDDRRKGTFRGIFSKDVVDGLRVREGVRAHAPGSCVLDLDATLAEHRRAVALVGGSEAVWVDTDALACATCGHTYAFGGQGRKTNRNMQNHQSRKENKGCVGSIVLRKGAEGTRGLYRVPGRNHLTWVGARAEIPKRGQKRPRVQVHTPTRSCLSPSPHSPSVPTLVGSSPGPPL